MHNSTKSIAILLATYNGERYVAEQICSLLSQTLQGWTLYVHDDGSTDGTYTVLQELASKHQEIRLLDYPSQGGAMKNFFSLLERVEADYYFFCDQDDHWLPDKMEKTMERMAQLEAQHPDTPIVVHSDLYVADDNLNIVEQSFLKYSGIHPDLLTTFSEAGVSGLVTGCTMCFNARAKQVMHHPYTHALMHDEWIALSVLKRGGIVSLIPTPLMLYRQHFGNVVGAKDRTKLTITSRLKHLTKFLRQHFSRYRMLRSLGYGPYLKFILYKIIYKYRIKTIKSPKDQI